MWSRMTARILAGEIENMQDSIDAISTYRVLPVLVLRFNVSFVSLPMIAHPCWTTLARRACQSKSTKLFFLSAVLMDTCDFADDVGLAPRFIGSGKDPRACTPLLGGIIGTLTMA
jgi:hypothetical protein